MLFVLSTDKVQMECNSLGVKLALSRFRISERLLASDETGAV